MAPLPLAVLLPRRPPLRPVRRLRHHNRLLMRPRRARPRRRQPRQSRQPASPILIPPQPHRRSPPGKRNQILIGRSKVLPNFLTDKLLICPMTRPPTTMARHRRQNRTHRNRPLRRAAMCLFERARNGLIAAITPSFAIRLSGNSWFFHAVSPHPKVVPFQPHMAPAASANSI